MRTFRMPEIFLSVRGEDRASIRDEICNVDQIVVVFFDDGPGDDAHVQLFC